MKQAFIISQIGDPQIDHLCAHAIVPALESLEFDAKRVDKHNKGGLLKSEIIQFIQSSEIIVADLTNARPNVYLEIGYAMGIDKFSNLVLVVREDHFPSSQNYDPHGPRIHFDLAGYDILAWNADRLDEFRVELEKRIRRRLTILLPSQAKSEPAIDEDWVIPYRVEAFKGIGKANLKGHMELRAGLGPPKPQWNQKQLRDAVKDANIHTFGWPIVPFIDNPDLAPKPREDGIKAELSLPEERQYDFWAVRKSGDVFFVGSFFEDERNTNQLFFNTRIIRVAESFLFLVRFYTRLGVDRSARLSVGVAHRGLEGRTLTEAGGWHSHPSKPSEVDRSDTVVEGTLDSFEANLVDYVIAILSPVFTLFDYKEYPRNLYEHIVQAFVEGRLR